MRNNTAFIDAMTEDWNRFLSVAQTDREGNRLNIIKVDGVDSADEKVIGKRLQEIAKNATTGGLYTQVGELYGFPIKVVSERILKEGLEFTDNRFVVRNYKYTYNNGHLAMADPMAAARNFLNAMERIPSIIDQYKAKNECCGEGDTALQEICGQGVEEGEDELKQLKSRTCRLDRKYSWNLRRRTPLKSPKRRKKATGQVKRKMWGGTAGAISRKMLEQAGAISRKCTAADTQSGG